MSQAWEKLIETDDGALLKCLTLSRVSISKQTGDMRVTFQSSRILRRDEYKFVAARMASAFPMVRVQTRVCYFALSDAVRADLSVASGLMKEQIRHESPGSMPFIDWEGRGWSLDGEKLTVCVSSAEGMNYLKARGVDRMLEKLMAELFDIRCTVGIQLTGDDERRIREIAAARAREAEALAMDTAKAAQAAGGGKKAAPVDTVYGKPIHDPALPMNELTEDVGRCTVRGEVSGLDMRDTKNGKTKIVSFLMSDSLGSVNCKLFLGGRRGGEDAKSIQAQADALSAALKDGKWITARGSYRYDDFKREMVLMVNDIMEAEKPVRRDTAAEKRVELHLHTTFSTMDACATATDLIKQAAAWGHRAVAVTDHGVVQSFPEAFGAAKKAGIKLIPGCEGYLIEDAADIVKGASDETLDGTPFVVLDVETTGLNTHTDEIIEIGAVRFENGVEVAEFSELINPGRPLPEKIVEITGITPGMLRGQRTLKEAMPDFAKFCEGAVLVAHNAEFDMSFFRRAFPLIGRKFDFTTLDTLALSRNLYPGFKNHKLGTLCKLMGVSLTNAHRAVHDARATAMVLMKMLAELKSLKNISMLREINTCFAIDAGKKAYHIILLATSQTGITNLYRIVSEGHLNYFHRTPRLPRSVIQRYREGLIVGSACESGELFRAVLAGESDETLEKIAKFYDYLEVQPIGNNAVPRARGRGGRRRGTARAEPQDRPSGREAEHPGVRHRRRALPEPHGQHLPRHTDGHQGLRGRGLPAAAVLQDHGRDAGGVFLSGARQGEGDRRDQPQRHRRPHRRREGVPAPSRGKGDLPALLARGRGRAAGSGDEQGRLHLRNAAARNRAEAHRQGAGRHHRLRLLHAVHDRREAGGQVPLGRLHRRLPRLGRLVAGGQFLGHYRGQLAAAPLRLPQVQAQRIRRAEGVCLRASTCRRRTAPSAARPWTRTASTSPSRSFWASRATRCPTST